MTGLLFAVVFGLAFGLPLAIVQRRRAVRRERVREVQLSPRSFRGRR